MFVENIGENKKERQKKSFFQLMTNTGKIQNTELSSPEKFKIIKLLYISGKFTDIIDLLDRVSIIMQITSFLRLSFHFLDPRHRHSLHTEECSKVHGSTWMALVEAPHQNHTYA